MTGRRFVDLLLTIPEHACSGMSNVGEILMAQAHPNHDATRTLSV